ncbi:uncharacterized protein LOC116567093 [Mustela erminea]|uniref:uncharacterized protein LOC116567093 n=1 Tax=Mustela erminea TaxID=36723 RepID=UPI0013873574|nr:uncharacterized protein LOC116567093 [Mustela erminea]
MGRKYGMEKVDCQLGNIHSCHNWSKEAEMKKIEIQTDPSSDLPRITLSKGRKQLWAHPDPAAKFRLSPRSPAVWLKVRGQEPHVLSGCLTLRAFFVCVRTCQPARCCACWASGLLWRLFSAVTIVLCCWGATSHDSEGWTRGVDEPITRKACCAQSPEGPLRLDMDSNSLPKTPSPHLQCHRSKEKSSAPFETIWPLRQAFGPLAL